MSAENEIRNIKLFEEEIRNIKQMAFDAAHPIGETYVQYPQQDDPMTIYNKNGVTSVWEEQLQYNGAFFRSSNALSTVWKVDDEDGYYTINGNTVTPVKVVAENGGGVSIGAATGNTRTIDEKTYKEYSVNGYSNAAAGYINKTKPLSIQGQGTAQNGLYTHSGDGYAWYTSENGGWSGQFNCEGTDSVYAGAFWTSLSGEKAPATGDSSYWKAGTVYAGVGNHRHIMYLASSDSETRPSNYTYTIWKRIA